MKKRFNSGEIYRLWESGYTKKRIAKALGISKCLVRDCLVIRYGECVEYQGVYPSKRFVCRTYSRNTNAPTPDTVMLICSYYREDIEKGLSHEIAVEDIHFELGRDYDYIHRVLSDNGCPLRAEQSCSEWEEE